MRFSSLTEITYVTMLSHPPLTSRLIVSLYVPAAVATLPFSPYSKGNCSGQIVSGTVLVSVGLTYRRNVHIESHPP